MRPFTIAAGFMASFPKVLPETKAAAALLRWKTSFPGFTPLRKTVKNSLQDNHG
jgi:hypothetical protein